jgi:hypothetical protein
MAFLRTHLEPKLRVAKFQHQAHDSVLRQAEREHKALAKACFYILSNPVAAKLVTKPDEWNFCGAVVPGCPTLHPLAPDFWETFWALYARGLHPDAGKIKRPPF